MSTPAVSPEVPKKEFSWKRLFIKAAGFGAGFAILFAVLAGVGLWYLNRPKSVKAWDTTAIKAEYLSVGVQPEQDDVQVGYVLENTTISDYEIRAAEDVKIAMVLGNSNSLSPFNEYASVDVPLFIPAKHKVQIDVHLKVKPAGVIKHGASDEERDKLRQAILKQLNTELSGLKGFVLLDQNTRYEVDFPNGWKQEGQATAK